MILIMIIIRKSHSLLLETNVILLLSHILYMTEVIRHWDFPISKFDLIQGHIKMFELKTKYERYCLSNISPRSSRYMAQLLS